MINNVPVAILWPVLVIFGLIIGSFLNVCIYRLPREKSVILPRSFCPKCRVQLKWYDNVPLFSYIFLLGKCRVCKRAISMRYPVVELLSGFFSWFVFYHFGQIQPYIFYYLFLISPLIVITFIDLEHKIIPDVITLPGIIIGGFSHYMLIHGRFSFVIIDVILGVIVGGGFLALIGFAYEWLKKREGLGGGDVKLAAMLGAFFGWKGVIFILFMSSVIGSLIGIIMLLAFKKDAKYAIPYGPFLSLGAVVYLFWGEAILGWYFGLI